MNQHKIYEPLILSFYSKSLYRDVAKNWQGTGFLYLLLVAGVAAFVTTVKFHRELSKIPSETAPIIAQVPDIRIQQGKISIEQDEPYFINDPSQDLNPVIIIDTTGKFTSLDDTDAQILITEKKIIARDRIYDLSALTEIEKIKITKEGITKIVRLFSQWFAVIALLFIFVFIFVFRIIHVLIFGLFGILFSKIMKLNMNFEKLMRLSAIAITPVIIANILLSFLNVQIPFLGGLAISLIYLFMGIRFSAQQDAEQQ
ncbi:MAG: DUF1189 family protein [bacterium]